jgi:hypothetical protein
MATGESLVITVVMGLLLVGATAAVARLRSSGSGGGGSRLALAGGGRPALAGEPEPEPSDVPSELLVFGALVVVAALVGAALVVDVVLVVVLALSTVVTAYLAWGTYTLARARGLPAAHSVGLSAWLVGVVLVGAIGVKLMLG